MEKIKLNICSLGNPTDPRTWSGTPYNLYSELVKKNKLGIAFDSTAIRSNYVKMLPKLFNKIYYKNSVDPDRGFLFRYLNARKVKNETFSSNTNLTLHTGTLDLPFLRVPENQEHYLYCDSTWNLWSSHSTGMNGYSEKLLIDAEDLEKRAYNQMAHIFPISNYVKKNLIEHYGISADKITVVGTGLGIIKPFYGQKDYSNNKILFAAKGRFEDKGGHLVLEAFEIALKSNPRLELSIVGQNEYTEKIKIPNVKSFGFISIEELQTMFNECSLFLMPATNEPWGLVYLEALACKMPIVGLNKNSFPEISDYGNYGFGLDSTNPEDLAQILLRSFENSEKLREMGSEAQKYCLNQFSWEQTVDKIIQTIEQIKR